MHRSLVFYTCFIGLIGAGVWGVLRIIDGPTNSSTSTEKTPSALNHQLDTTKKEITPSVSIIRNKPENTQPDSTNIVIKRFLDQGDYSAMAEYINQEYSRFSATTLTRIQSMLINEGYSLQRSGAKSSALRLYRATTDIFNDLQSWGNLSDLAVGLKQWQTAFDATLSASLLQSDSIGLENAQRRLVTIAANLRSELEQQGNKLGVHKIYEAMYKAHPGNPRFQLELAFSYLRLERTDEAKRILEQLQYDTELGDISRNTLAKINANTAAQDQVINNTENNASLGETRNIEIPLRKLGTNLLANVQVNQRTVSLLLDTGASITALDLTLIKQLKLTDTGRSITLSTANGVRKAKLYRAQRVRLGRFTLQDQIVAGIDLGGASKFVGLLGTDILNTVSRDYSYLIDNRRSALIFTPK